MRPTPRPRPRNRRIAGLALAALTVTGVAAGCGDGAAEVADMTLTAAVAPAPDEARGRGDAAAGAAAAVTEVAGETAVAAGGSGEVPASPLAGLVRPLDSAVYDPAEHTPAVPPVALSIDGIGVAGVSVRDVGLLPSGEMEIPEAEEVGWYRLSPAPGDAGSSVLAGHIAYNGRDGAFRYLADVPVGAGVQVTLADGTIQTFTVTAVQQYPKDGLPAELFRTDGPPVLTLITCGGTFQPSLRSYDSNIVVTAVPVG